MKAAFLSKDIDTQSEGMRASVNLVVYGVEVSLFILDHELDPDLAADEEFQVWLNLFQDEMEAPVYSNVRENEKHGFQYLTVEEIGRKLGKMDIVIPF